MSAAIAWIDEVAPSSGRRRAGSQQVLRQVAMLQLLPIHPRWIGTTTLRERLAAQGFRTSARTLQRDLLALQTVFPLQFDPQTRPYAWRWSRDADPHPLPVAVASTAVRFVAVVTPAVLRRIGEAKSRPHGDGRRRITMTVAGGPALRRWVLGFGAGMEVLEPEWLREEVREIACAMAARYEVTHHSAVMEPLDQE